MPGPAKTRFADRMAPREAARLALMVALSEVLTLGFLDVALSLPLLVTQREE